MLWWLAKISQGINHEDERTSARFGAVVAQERSDPLTASLTTESCSPGACSARTQPWQEERYPDRVARLSPTGYPHAHALPF